jgi:hypothetical protein
MPMTANSCHPAAGPRGCERAMMAPLGKAEIERVENALQDWRQGDAILDADIFMVHLADRRFPLTAAARAAAVDIPDEHDIFDVLTPEEGLVVVTQTCDIIKKCADSAFVEVCPLVYVEDENLIQDVRKSRRPRYAFLPRLAERKLVVDLERTMTIEKTVLAGWSRVEGCVTDEERVDFADALARKRKRFAFPDGFNTGLSKFRNNIKDKHGKNSSEGRLVEAIHEIRVQPNPNWDSPEVEVFFWFLLKAGILQDFDMARADIGKWINRIAFPDMFILSDPAFALVEPMDMTVADYFNSYLLDYDDVSL